MMYNELQHIAKSKIKLHHTTLPANSMVIALHLGLTVKDSTQCEEDFHGDSPLLKSEAIYAIYNGEYTIYYDEKNSYHNFFIAHEIAHHLLGHTSDGAEQHYDANLLAAIIIAPEELIYLNNIHNAYELSKACVIPLPIAIEYWDMLSINRKEISSDYLSQFMLMMGDMMKLMGNMCLSERGGYRE